MSQWVYKIIQDFFPQYDMSASAGKANLPPGKPRLTFHTLSLSSDNLVPIKCVISMFQINWMGTCFSVSWENYTIAYAHKTLSKYHCIVSKKGIIITFLNQAVFLSSIKIPVYCILGIIFIVLMASILITLYSPINSQGNEIQKSRNTSSLFGGKNSVCVWGSLF